jgi:hypothetical protein
MIIELRNIHARWMLLIENGCMLLANENGTVWDLTGFGMCGCVTNKGKTNSMEGRDVANLIGREAETAKPTSPRTGLVPFTGLILPMDPFYPLDPAVWRGLEQCDGVSPIQILRGWKR